VKIDLKGLYELLYDSWGEQHWWPAESRDEIIIGAILTQNTNWNNVVKALNALKSENLCSLTAIRKPETAKIAKLIRPSGYYNVKAERLKVLVSVIIEKNYEKMTLQDARKSLLAVKGVGNETADSILLYAFNKPIFVIDAYTIRILQRIYPKLECKNYNDYQELFHRNLPPDYLLFNEFHALLVKLGKTLCRKSKPHCQECPLASEIDNANSFVGVYTFDHIASCGDFPCQGQGCPWDICQAQG